MLTRVFMNRCVFLICNVGFHSSDKIQVYIVWENLQIVSVMTNFLHKLKGDILSRISNFQMSISVDKLRLFG